MRIPPFVVSSSIAEGAVVPPGPLFEVVTFSEPMDTAAVTTSSFDLHGILDAVDYAPAFFSWDPTATILTISYSALPVDDYTETLFASGFPDLGGLNLDNNFVVDFCSSSTGACPVSTVPEPSNLVLLGVSILGFAFARRHKAA
jgi:hypothetical protein